MKNLICGTMLLASAVALAGCTQSGTAEKKPADETTPSTAASSNEETRTVEHTTMKPVTPAEGGEQKAATPEAKPEAAAAPANADKPVENN